MTFGQRIAYARKQMKMTQSDLGKAVGTSAISLASMKGTRSNLPSTPVPKLLMH